MNQALLLLHLGVLALADTEVTCDATDSTCHARAEQARTLLQHEATRSQKIEKHSDVAALSCAKWCKPKHKAVPACSDCEFEEAAAPCDGNCAAKGTVTSSPEFSSDCGLTTGGPYSPTTCPMYYLGWSKNPHKFCEGTDDGGPWVQVDLGVVTAFDTIEVVQPQRKNFSPPGYCGLEVWIDGKSVFSQPGYTENPQYEGAYQITAITGSFTGQKVKVKYGRSAKNPTAHLFGINIKDSSR